MGSLISVGQSVISYIVGEEENEPNAPMIDDGHANPTHFYGNPPPFQYKAYKPGEMNPPHYVTPAKYQYPRHVEGNSNYYSPPNPNPGQSIHIFRCMVNYSSFQLLYLLLHSHMCNVLGLLYRRLLCLHLLCLPLRCHRLHYHHHHLNSRTPLGMRYHILEQQMNPKTVLRMQPLLAKEIRIRLLHSLQYLCLNCNLSESWAAEDLVRCGKGCGVELPLLLRF